MLEKCDEKSKKEAKNSCTSDERRYSLRPAAKRRAGSTVTKLLIRRKFDRLFNPRETKKVL